MKTNTSFCRRTRWWKKCPTKLGHGCFFYHQLFFFSPSMELTTLSIFQADAIMSRLNIDDYQKEGSQPTLLITSDIVCLDYLCIPNWVELLFHVDFEVVVHEGIIREKPTTKEEARQFLKGYSGGHVSTVGSVVVTNLTTGKRLGSLDKAEAIFTF
ncbi:hypothetical protein Zm00014a_029456 [Zea mays]|uniref:Uncharacterized protein n=1 Tax=Zea mays TaxID=4577 RepID=A0A3L6FVQ4_MAIZE|nr:hypothetical protein Zm00014a_029456 [Zea mays]